MTNGKAVSITGELVRAVLIGSVILLAAFLFLNGAGMVKAANPECSVSQPSDQGAVGPRGIEDSGWTNDSLIYSDSSDTERYPSIAVDRNNDLWVAYEHDDPTDGYYAIYLSNSSDNGRTWTLRSTYVNYSTHDALNPKIAIDLWTNEIYVVYEYVVNSTDRWILVWNFNGTSNNIYLINFNSSYFTHPTIAIEYLYTNNYIMVAYEEVVDSDNRNLWFARSINNGVTWKNIELKGSGIDNDVYCQPSICVGTNSVYIAYRHGTDYSSTCDIDIATSDDEGLTWAYGTDRDFLSFDCSYPSITVSRNNGTIYYAYQYHDSGDGSYHVRSIRHKLDTITYYIEFTSLTGNDLRPAVTVDFMSRIGLLTGNFHLAYWYNYSIYYLCVTYSGNVGSLFNVSSKRVAGAAWGMNPAITTQNISAKDYPVVAYTYMGINYDVYSTAQDGIAPANPNSSSSTPLINTWSNATNLQISWSGSSDTEPGTVSRYYWKIDPVSNTVPDSTASDTTATSLNTPILEGSAVYFHVRSKDWAGNFATGAYHVGPFKIDRTAPANPTSLGSTSHTVSIWSNDSTIDVRWSGAADALSGVAGYSYIWDTSASTLPDASSEGAATSTTSPSLASGNSWYFHLRTVDAVGNWNATAIHLGPFWIDVTPPGNPTSLGSTSHQLSKWSNDSTVDVRWSGAADADSGVAGYSYIWDTSASTLPDASSEGAATSTTSPSLASGNSWYFHLRTVDAAGNWNATAIHLGPFWIDVTPPGNPTSLASTSHQLSKWSNDSTVDVRWSGAADGHSGVAGYSYTWDTLPTTLPDTSSEGAAASTTSFALMSWNSWYFHLRTVDAVGNWNATAIHLGPFWIDVTPPNNPTSLTSTSHSVSRWSNDSTVDVGWSGAMDAHSGVANYSYSWDTSPSTLPDSVNEGAGTCTTSPVLESGNSWYFHLRTADAVGNWNATAIHLGPFWIDVTEPVNPVSLASTGHDISKWSNDSTVDVGWSGASDAHSGVAGYSFVWDNSPSTYPDSTMEGTETCTTSPALTDGNNHYFHIRTVDAVGNWNSAAVHLGPFWIDTVQPSFSSIIINQGAPYTTTTAVSLVLTATDSLSGIADMAFSNDGSIWTAWTAYTASKQYTLPGPDGTNTIYLNIRDAAGNEFAPPYANDTIVLDRAPPESSVASLPEKSSPSFTVSWTGDDATSRIDFWNIQYRIGDAGTWTDWQTKVASTSAQFSGAVGNKYYFRSQAQDKAGNLEGLHGTPDTFTTVVNMPSLLLTWDFETIQLGGTANLTVVASKNDTPISGMALSLSSTGGTLTSTSGTTDAAGQFTCKFSSTATGRFTITVKGDKTGYDHVETTISITVVERVLEEFKVELSADRLELISGQNAVLTVSALKGTSPAAGAAVKLSTNLGVIGAPEGTTDALGKYSTTFTAPVVVNPSQATITLTASKDGQNKTQQLKIQINPKPTSGLHIISLEASPSELKSMDSTSTITVFVERNGAAVSGAAIQLTTDKGTFEPPTGTTDVRGYFKTVYSPSKDGAGTRSIVVKAQYLNDSDEQSLVINVAAVPTVTIQSPQPGAVVTGKVTISGIASLKVILVQVNVGGEDEWHLVSGTTSWTYIWTTTNFANGQYKISAKAFDGSQYSAVTELTVTVANVPKLTVTAAPPEKTVKGTLELSGTSSSYTTKVSYQIDDGPFIDANETASGWAISVDTKDLRDGSHTIKIRASAENVSSPLEEFPFKSSNHATVGEPLGAASLLLPILAIIILVVVVAIILVLLRKKNPPAPKTDAPPVPPPESPGPVVTEKPGRPSPPERFFPARPPTPKRSPPPTSAPADSRPKPPPQIPPPEHLP